MTKADIEKFVMRDCGVTKGHAKIIVNLVVDNLIAATRRGERIEIRGFGSFRPKHYAARKGRNPRTGAAVNVKPRATVYFKPCKELKQLVKEGLE